MKKNKVSPKIIAMYLPQFHEIPENNLFWGEGFTDWVGVKGAKPLFEGHYQPKIPLKNNYYDLSQHEVLEWQAQLAKKYGVFGFCFYHYWFEGDKTVLETPARNLLEHKEIQLPFCFAWDNTSWVRSWSNIDGNAWAPQYEKGNVDEQGRPYLLKLEYGAEEEWKRHFEFLLPYFKDERYIKKDGQPIFMLFSTKGAEHIEKMGAYWKKLAKENGLPGLYLISKCDPIFRKKLLDTEFIYQPIRSGWQRKLAMKKAFAKVCKIECSERQPEILDYDKVWRKVLRDARKNGIKNIQLGGFVNYDDTPRRGKKGKVIINGSPEKFKKYFEKLYYICKTYGKEYLFITAWNEWGEGAYLEPDSENEYNYLEAIRAVVGEQIVE